jgi:Domain of unknown function (DUF4123)
MPLTVGESEELRQMVDKMPAQRFAVFDGAVFDDLPGELRARSTRAVSLFRDHPDIEVERAGPWLISLNSAENVDDAFALMATSSQASGVFWSCELGEADVLHHLRTINMVLLPTYGMTSHEAVMFRHWDPNVLAIVLGVLETNQLIELLGPAQQIVFSSPDFGGVFQCKAKGPKELAPHG